MQLINDAIIEMDCNMEDLVMANVAADIDEVRDVILALMPRLHTAHCTGQERMRGLYDISPQPNTTPMSGSRGRRNNTNQDRPVFGQMYW